jgi:hypothetical protein
MNGGLIAIFCSLVAIFCSLVAIFAVKKKQGGSK